MQAANPAAPRPPPADVHDYHPLEIIPFFRRYPPGTWRDVLYTFIWNCALGGIFFGLAVIIGGVENARVEGLVWNLIMANVIGYSIHALFLAGAGLGLERRARASGSIPTAAYYTGISSIGVVGGFMLVASMVSHRLFVNWLREPRWVGVMIGSCFLISGILSAVFYLRERQARSEAELERERLRAERVEREAAHANLRALQAQIEPHFLFNTLANVSSLIDSDPALSKRMLERFIRFLRNSLAATRAETTTLGAEGELIAAYLDVLQVRMGDRLRYAIDIDPALGGFALPPMLLQPVVENAIRHGLEPRVEGGEVRLTARRLGDAVTIEVADTGVGFAPSTRGGTGLTNLRDRLRLLHGARAGLSVSENPAGGTVVTITLPA